MASFTDRLAILITASGAGAVRELEGIGSTAESSMAKAETSTGKFKSVIGGLIPGLGGASEQGLSLGKALGVGVAGGAVAGGAALVDFAAKGISAFESATGEVRGLQRVMGGSAEDASKLRFAAKALGVDLDAVGRGAGLLAKSIGNGTSKLRDYGVEVARDKQGNVDMAGTIANVAQAYQATDDPARRAAIGAAAFGRGWQQMAPILSKSKQQIQELYSEAGKQHQVFNANDLDQGRQLSLATRELNTEVQGLEIEFAQGLVPALSGATRGATELLQAADKLLSPLGGLGNVLGKMEDQGIRMIPGFGALAGAIEDSSSSSDKATGAAERNTVAEQKRKTAIQETTAQLAAETNALSDQVGGEVAYEASIRQLAQATDDYRAKQLLALAAKGKDPAANQAANDSLFALKQQIDATAEAAKQKAIEDAGPNTSALDKARLGNEAFRTSLEAAANSSIPAVRQQAIILLGTLQGFEGHVFHASIDLDTADAYQKLADLKGHATEVIHFLQGGK